MNINLKNYFLTRHSHIKLPYEENFGDDDRKSSLVNDLIHLDGGQFIRFGPSMKKKFNFRLGIFILFFWDVMIDIFRTFLGHLIGTRVNSLTCLILVVQIPL
ncbi:hypothetical protein EON73_04320 [bacterium]|nr:MAG: hypothetical protein EON73_04320 [bacterium]